MTRKPTGLLLLALAAMLFSACAESIGDVNRVQPNYYAKKTFEGTWYYRQTVIDVPYENSWLFNGIGSDIEKIRWEVQEKTLLAYRVNELIFGANGESSTGKPEYTPVAAWAISSHFDIVRDYNPGTGEESNVINENTSDRPWYQRDYIRVDWSKNLVPNQNGLDTFLGFTNTGRATSIAMTGANYWVQSFEEDNPDRFEISDGYIGVVGRYNVEPDVYTCYLAFNNMWGTGVGGNCGPSTIKMRSSFMRINELASDYEPLEYSDRRPLVADMDLNGDGKIDENDRIEKKLSICADLNADETACSKYADIACTEDIINRLNADPFYRQFGYKMDNCRDAGSPFYEKFGYFRTEHITYDRDRGLTETGRVNFANRWNIWKSSKDKDGKPIPFAKREVKPIEYYLNADFPEDLFDAAEEIQRQWNEAFKQTVAALQGKTVDEVADVYFIHKNGCALDNVRSFVAGNKAAQQIVNRVIGGIDNLAIANQERVCSALEYNLGSDKFTWQKNGDLRYSYVYWVDRPQRAGPLGFGPSYSDPDSGEMINGTAYVYGAGVDSYAAFATDLVELLAGRQTVDEVIGGDSIRENVFENARRAAQSRYSVDDIPQAFFDKLAERGAAYDTTKPNGGLPEILPDQFEARLARLKGTSLERELGLNEPMLMLANPNWKPGDTVTDEHLEAASPSNLFSRAKKSANDERLLHLTEKHCMMMADFVDDSIIGLAMEYPGDPDEMSRDEIYKDLRHHIFIGVMLHEVGHTLGLRHNFNGSADALNYRPEFWKYSKLNVSPVAAKSDPSLDATEVARLDRCIEKAEAWGIPVPSTLDCLRASEMKQSSIMDYGAKFNSDFQGLGKYDKAAIAFGYGQLVEVFDDSVTLPEGSLDNLLFTDDYTKIPTHLGSAEKIQARKLVSYDEVNKVRAQKMIDGAYNLPKFQNGQGCVENCGITEPSREVPYMFCTDNFAGWRLFCDRWDEGATQTEIVQSAVDQFHNYYIFNAFKRDRFNWSYTGYVNRMMTRTFPSFSNAFIYYFLYRQYQGYDFVNDLALASVIGLNLFGEILQSPEPGYACWSDDYQLYLPAENWRNCDATTPESVYIPQGMGRHYWTEYSDNYHYEPVVVPGFLEKVYTIIGMTQSDARYFRVNDGDSSTTTINYYRIFKDEMLTLLGGIIVDDDSAFSGRVVEESPGKFVYHPRLLVDPYTFGGDPAPVGDEDGRPMLASTSYDLRFYSTLFGMAYLTSQVDQSLDFKNYFKVSLKGATDDIEYGGIDKDDPDQYIEFTEPNSHYTYYAAATADGHSYGYKLVKMAADIYNRPNTGWLARKAELDALTPADEGYAEAQRLFKNVNQELLWRVEYLDTMRSMQRAFEFGG